MNHWRLVSASLVLLVVLSSCVKAEPHNATAVVVPNSPASSSDGSQRDVPEPKQRAYAQIDKLRMYYEVYGEGRPLVLLHGGGSTIAESWPQQIAYFASKHRIIAPEQQGHGHTRDLDRPLSYVEMADDTAQLLTQLGIRDADVLGWSDGGIVGLILAAHHPELVRRLVVSGANISPSGLVPDGLAEITRPAEEDPADRARYERVSADPPEHYAAFKAKLDDLWRNHPTEAELSVADLKKIAAPTLVVAADRDLILLDHTVLIYRSIPNAELLILPGSNHNTFGKRAKWLESDYRGVSREED